MSLICPHCQQKTLRIRSSRQTFYTLKRIWVQCTNLHCGFTGSGYTEITHQISAPAHANSEVKLAPYHKYEPLKTKTPQEHAE